MGKAKRVRRTTVVEELVRLQCCPPAIAWVRSQRDQRLSVLWRNCPNGDWLNFLHWRVGLDVRERLAFDRALKGTSTSAPGAARVARRLLTRPTMHNLRTGRFAGQVRP